MGFNYQDKSAPKLSDEFKQQFVVKINGKVETIKVDGLIAFAHEKGIKSMETAIVQFPNQENQWTCIAQAKVLGYDYNPATEKIEEVLYSDFADASPANCTAMTKNSYIRMASTRSIGRTLRKYTNINMVTAEEISNSIDEYVEPISTNTLTAIQTTLLSKNITKEDFAKIMYQKFQHTNYMGLNNIQGKELVAILNNFVPQPKKEQAPTSTPKSQE